MDKHEHEEHMANLDALQAQVDALHAKYEHPAADRRAATHEHQAQMAELARIQESLKQTQAALDPARLTTTVTQVRRWAGEETHPNWFWAAYANLAQRLARVEGLLEEMADNQRMIIGQWATLERQEPEK